jgi:hypothetical protein
MKQPIGGYIAPFSRITVLQSKLGFALITFLLQLFNYVKREITQRHLGK